MERELAEGTVHNLEECVLEIGNSSSSPYIEVKKKLYKKYTTTDPYHGKMLCDECGVTVFEFHFIKRCTVHN